MTEVPISQLPLTDSVKTSDELIVQGTATQRATLETVLKAFGLDKVYLPLSGGELTGELTAPNIIGKLNGYTVEVTDTEPTEIEDGKIVFVVEAEA